MLRLTLSILLWFALALPASAIFHLRQAQPEGQAPAATTTRPAPGVRERVQERREGTQERAQQQRQETRQQAQEQREGVRREFQERLEQLRTERAQRVEAERAQLRERLQRVRDQKKREAVERIDRRLAELNERMLDHFKEVLTRLEGVLERIRTRAARAQERGLDASSVNTAITQAEEKIASARSAIEAQAAKTYAITVNTEGTLRRDVGQTRQALHNDLKVARESVFVARDAVHRAAVTLAQIPRVDEPEPAPAPTATTTP